MGDEESGGRERGTRSGLRRGSGGDSDGDSGWGVQAGMRVLQVATPADLLVMIQLVMMAELRQHLL